MKKKHFAITVFFLSLFFLSLSHTYHVGHGTSAMRKSTGPPACHAGEPPNNITCRTSGCHSSFPLNSGTALLNLDLGDAESSYTPGEDYIISVSLFKPGLMRGGFQLVALQDNNDTISPGVFTLTDSFRTQRIDKENPHAHPNCSINSKVWIEHTENGIDDVFADSITWQFDWQAPEIDVGSITFYLASVEADVDLDATGDYVYAKTKTVSSTTTSLNEAVKENNVFVYPNPASDFLNIAFPETALANKNNSVAISDLSGKVLFKSVLTNSISIQELLSGNYIVIVEINGRSESFPFIKI